MRSCRLLLLFLAKAFGLFALCRWLTRHQLRILCYHGFELADECAFRPKLFVSSALFERRLATLERHGYRVLKLDEAIDRLYQGSLPAYSLVITVDDGWQSFQRVAVPILQRHACPATVYLTTYHVEKATPVFGIVVQYMFWKTHKTELRLQNLAWSEDGVLDLANPRQTEQAVMQCIDFGERQCSEEGRQAICEQLGALLDTPYEQIVRARLFHLMTPEELQALPDLDIDVELHTHRHRFPIDDQADAEREIADNRASLQKWGHGPRQHFCYPSGVWDERQWQWLENMQVKSSTTCLPGLNSRETPRHALRRMLDGEHTHQLEFEARLCGFSAVLHGAARPRTEIGRQARPAGRAVQ